MPRVIHTGQAMVDAVVTISHLPQRGSNVMANSYTRYAGGSINILVGAARMGADAVLAGAHGRGPNGDLVRAVLQHEQIAVSAPVTDDTDTGICFVMVEASGERTFVTTLGAERRITVDSLATSSAAGSDIVHVSGYTLAVPATRDPLMSWLAALPESVMVVLDPGPMFATLPDALRGEMLARTTVWTSNLTEARHLTGADDGLRTVTDALAAVLPERSVVIVRDGDAGCAVHSDHSTAMVPGYPQQAVDTNGAGDCHTGVLSAELARGADWVQACDYANAAAAIKVTRRGPATSPTRQEVDAFLSTDPARSPVALHRL